MCGSMQVEGAATLGALLQHDAVSLVWMGAGWRVSMEPVLFHLPSRTPMESGGPTQHVLQGTLQWA